MKTIVSVGSLLLLSTLAACGGGGEGAGGTQASGTAAATAEINDQNADAKTAAAYQAATSLYDAGSGTDVGLKSVGDGSGATRLSVFGRALGRLESLATETLPSPVGIQASSTSSVECPDGGNVAIVVADADDDNRLSTGDTASITYTACQAGGATLSGSMALTNVVVTGAVNDAQRSLSATFVYSDLSIISASGVDSIDGQFTVQTSLQRQPSVVTAAVISGTTLRMTHGGVARELADFDSSIRIDHSNATFRYSLSGALVSDGILVTNPVAFEGALGSFPSTGQLKVTGARQTSVTLTAVDDTNARIDVDSNGDGTIDSSRTRTWTSIASQH